MAPIKFQSDPLSYNSLRAELVLTECGIEFEKLPADLQTNSHKTPEFLEASPFGNIPLLYLEDGTPIYESRAICRVLAYKFKASDGSSLTINPGEKGYEKFEQALSVEAMKFDPYFSPLAFHKLIAPLVGLPSDDALIQRSLKYLKTNLGVVDGILAKQKYMAGDTFTVADVNWMPGVEILFLCGDGNLITDRPNLKRWWEEVSARPTWQKVVGPCVGGYRGFMQARGFTPKQG